MASTSKCPFCGAPVRSDERACPGCGAGNELYTVPPQQISLPPKTIRQLQEYCALKGMPLLRMRFFIGQNYQGARAFGIYQDGTDFVVYKNKADGTRAIRYRGPNEAYAVLELYNKLLDECHQRGIYPNGRPFSAPASRSTSTAGGGKKSASSRHSSLFYFFLSIIIVILISVVPKYLIHRKDGYYLKDNTLYYRYGNNWYCGSSTWYESYYDPFSYGNSSDYYLGSDYDSDWGGSDFKSSTTWHSLQFSSSSDRDNDRWDSWDSSDTDWDSDW